MSDLDEYIDNIVWDAQTFAVLDLEEKKHFSYRPLKRRRTTADARQQKIDGNLTPHFCSPSREPEDLPEISVLSDGTYGVRKSGAQANPHAQYHPPVGLVPQPSPGDFLSSRMRHLGTLPSSSASTMSVTQPKSRPPGQNSSDQILVEQYKKELQQATHALKEATTARLTKEGEVTVLRQGIEKFLRDHAAQLAKLRTEKDEALEMCARLKKEMQEERKRMKTQLAFKDYERESFRQNAESLNRKNATEESHFPDIPAIARGLPSVPQSRVELASVVPSNCNNPTLELSGNQLLPGFRNTFCDTTPLRMHQTHSVEPSRNLVNQSAVYHDLAPTYPRLHSKGTRNTPDHDAPDVSGNCVWNSGVPPIDTADTLGKLTTVSQTCESGDYFETVKDTGHVQLFQLTELSRIISMHSFTPHANSTIQTVIRAQFGETSPPEVQAAFSTSLESVMRVVSRSLDLEHSITNLSEALVSIVFALTTTKSFKILAPLFNLIAILVYCFPRIARHMLSCELQADSCLVPTLRDTIVHQQGIMEQNSCDVVAETISFLIALCFKSDENTRHLLIYITQEPEIWNTVFQHDRPTAISCEFLRFLVVLASHRKTCRDLLLSGHLDTRTNESVKVAKVAVVERLCLLLVDPSRKDAKSKELKNLILTFFTIISHSQTDGSDYISTSTSVIPSIMIYLSQLMSPWWEDDETVASFLTDHVASPLDILQPLILLHYLVNSSISPEKMQQNITLQQHRVFSGTMHHFVVIFGRLAYCEAPEWMDEQQQFQFQSFSEMARDILEFVMDDPDADRTCQTYQMEGDHEVDEDEMERTLLGEEND